MSISAVIKAIRDHGVDKTYIALFHDAYDGSTEVIIINQRTNKFPTRKGARQWDTIFPKLFTACLEDVFSEFMWRKTEIRIHGE